MNRLLAIVFIILYLIGINAFGSRIINKKADILDSKLEALYTIAENESLTLSAAITDVENYWEENEFFFALIINHKLTDELDEDILTLKHYVGINDEQHLMAKIAECRSMVQEIVKDDNFAWHNIF